MMKDTKDGQYSIPVEITDSEIEALQEVVDMYMGEEQTHAELNWYENNGIDSQEEWIEPEDGDHIYFSLKKINNLLIKIKERK